MALAFKTFNVSESATLPSDAPRVTRRIGVHASALKAGKVCAGDLLAVTKGEPWSEQREKVKAAHYAIGVAWPALDMLITDVALPSAMLATTRLAAGDAARLFVISGADAYQNPPGVPSLEACKDAARIVVEELGGSPFESKAEKAGKDKDWLRLMIKETLVGLKYITSSQILRIKYEGRERLFSISKLVAERVAEPSLVRGMEKLAVDTSDDTSQLWKITWDTVVTLADASKPASPAPAAGIQAISAGPNEPSSAYASVGGLDSQISAIRDLIELPLTRPHLFRSFGLKPPRGILLHGPPGTGKTHLARAIAASAGASVLIVNGPELSSAYHGETEARLRAVFDDARSKSPCIVVLDEVDALCPRREDASAGGGSEVDSRVVATLLTLMDGFDTPSSSSTEDADRVVVVATTNRPNALDPALRRPGRFDKEIEVGVPDAHARLQILRVLLANVRNTLTREELRQVAGRAHGYVGADLAALVREAGTRAIKRHLHPPPSEDEPVLHAADMREALKSVRPSALRAAYSTGVDRPVRYGDIGGLDGVVQSLRECVEWPLKHPEAFERLGVRAPSGVLLYGPPGCSKTTLVRALASESEVNYVAIKGPELLSKFVGDSERAVRDLFRKARGAAPCIVFFDEIDALAGARDGATTGTAEGVLTTLLAEMDGAQGQELAVTVVAATNRPEVLDAALLRPGRLDRLVYVGPPDALGREAVLRIKTAAMSVGVLDIAELAQKTEGFSGAEINAMCQEAALLTMKKDMGAPNVPHEAFVAAIKNIRKQITPDVLAKYEAWRDGRRF